MPAAAFLRFMSKDETREHAAQCHNMVGEQCPHGRELNLRVEERLDEESLMVDLRLAKGGVAGIDSFRCGDRPAPS